MAHSLRVGSFTLLALASGLFTTESRSQDDATSNGRARFHGEWQLASSPEEAGRVVNRAVEDAVSAMNFFVRPIARTRLRAGSPVHERITLAFDDDGTLEATFSAGGHYATPLGRTVRRRRPDGTRLRVTQRLRANALEQTFEGEQGTRWLVYRSRTPNQLTLEVTTDSDRMPRSMHYVLAYQRV